MPAMSFFKNFLYPVCGSAMRLVLLSAAAEKRVAPLDGCTLRLAPRILVARWTLGQP